jgi:hypothetical protein
MGLRQGTHVCPTTSAFLRDIRAWMELELDCSSWERKVVIGCEKISNMITDKQVHRCSPG